MPVLPTPTPFKRRVLDSECNSKNISVSVLSILSFIYVSCEPPRCPIFVHAAIKRRVRFAWTQMSSRLVRAASLSVATVQVCVQLCFHDAQSLLHLGLFPLLPTPYFRFSLPRALSIAIISCFFLKL